jgi:hypothetical protein
MPPCLRWLAARRKFSLNQTWLQDVVTSPEVG